MNPLRSTFLSALGLGLILAAAPLGRTQDPAPPPPAPVPEVQPAVPPAPATPAQPAEEQPAPADEPKAPAAPAEPAPPAEGELRELGVDDDKAAVSTPAPEAPKAPDAKKKTRKPRSYGVNSRNQDGPPFGGHTVPAGVKQNEAVSIFGDTTVDGEVSEAAVSVFGNTTVNGKVGDAAVSVLGTTTVNGHVGDAVVAVLGDVVLGPEAVVDGEVVAVLGKVVRSNQTVVKGGVQQIGGFGPFGGVEWLRAYVTKCVFWGRPLWFGEHLGWAWLVAGAFLVFYLLLALIFPRAVEKCAETLEERPGGTFVAALLTVLLSPILIVLLVFTGIGIAIIPFLGVGLFCASLFGKAAVLAWFGRRITKAGGFTGGLAHPVVAVFLGGLIVTVLYLIPILGFILYKLFGVLGTGMVVHRLALATKREKPATPAAPAAPAGSAGNPFTAPAGLVPPPLAATGGGMPAPAPEAGFAAPPPVAALTPLSAATLPRAGFWIRLGASALDAVLVGIVLAFISHLPLIGGLIGGFFPLWYAVYCTAMWQWKGTTIGGIICGLKVVRLDDRPLDWGVAVVRCLGGFLSACVAGLGFIWVAFDDEKQSWHDKIAGTTIVRVPKGTSLL